MKANRSKRLTELPPIQPSSCDPLSRDLSLRDVLSNELPPIPSPQEKKRGWFKNVVFNTLALVLTVGLIAGALEVTFQQLYLRDTSLDWLRWHPTRLYVNNPDLPDVYWDTEWNVNELGFRGPLPGEKTKPRILCLGDSSTFGYKFSYEESYPRRIEKQLSEYDVINTGTFSYTSYQGKLVFEEVYQEFQPDIVTIAFGYNDRRYVVSHDLIDNKKTFDRMYRLYSLHGYLSMSRVYQWLMQNRWVESLDDHPPVLSLLPRVNTLNYRRNIQDILDICREEGIKAILIYTGEKPDKHIALEAGIAALENGDYEEALANFEVSRNVKEKDAQVMGTYYKVITYQLLGRFEEADAIQYEYPYHFYFPGVNAVRSSHTYIKALKDLSIEYNAPLIQYRELIHHDSTHFIDVCHPDSFGYREIAGAVVEAVRNMNG